MSEKLKKYCRLCLSMLYEGEYIFEIGDKIKKLYDEFTNTELIIFADQKTYSCVNCIKSLQAALVVKNHFIANQQLLMNVDRFECESTMEINDFILEQYSSTPEDVIKEGIHEKKSAEGHENPSKKLKRSDTSTDSSSVPSQYPENKQAREVPEEALTSDLKTCYICLRSMKDLRNHMFHYHKNDLPRCDRCGKTFYKKESMQQHMINQYRRRRYPCQHCPPNKPKSYLTRASLALHIRTAHPQTIKIIEIQESVKV